MLARLNAEANSRINGRYSPDLATTNTVSTTGSALCRAAAQADVAVLAYDVGDLGERFHHHTVNHSIGEYVKHYFVHTNGLENAWSLFKRKVNGIHHWVSGEHLDRYLAEFTFRHNRRKMGEGQRVDALLGQVEERLTYKMLIA